MYLTDAFVEFSHCGVELKIFSCHPQCKLQETIDNEVHGFCSQSCLVNYHKINKQTCSVCDVCSNVYLDKRLTVTTEGSRKDICGDVCLVKFKQVQNCLSSERQKNDDAV